jgi:hypothetical protein
VDEGDHFAGGVGTPDVSGNLVYNHTACTNLSACPSNQIGEVNVKIGSVLPAGEPGYDIHFDDAPTFYVNGPAGQNGPGPTDPSVRKLERDVAAATAVDPYAGGAVPIAQRLADVVEEKTLHMINPDPKRTPTFTMFGTPTSSSRRRISRAAALASPPASIPASPGITGTSSRRSATRGLGSSGPVSRTTASTRRRGPTTPICGRRSSRCWAPKTAT